MPLYTPDWETLVDALNRVVAATHLSKLQAQIAICHAIADKKIKIRVVVEPSHIPDGGRTFIGGNVGLPPRLDPAAFDWARSRPTKPWSIGPVPGQHYTWIGGWQNRPISLVELSTADVRTVLCETLGTATDANTTQHPSGIINPKAKSNLPSRRRHKTVQSQIERAVIALAKERGGKFPPDDMSVFERDRLITEWLGGDDVPVRPSKRTLREYFGQKRD